MPAQLRVIMLAPILFLTVTTFPGASEIPFENGSFDALEDSDVVRAKVERKGQSEWHASCPPTAS